VEDRISALEDKIDIIEKTEEFKSCKMNTQESATPSKDQTCVSWALKKRCKP
jgi:hypothetical protein